MAKQLKFDVQARESLKNGLDTLADAVKGYIRTER